MQETVVQPEQMPTDTKSPPQSRARLLCARILRLSVVRIDTGFAISRVSTAIYTDRRRCSESGDPANQKNIDALLVDLPIQTKSVYRTVSKSEIKRVREVYATRDSVMPVQDWKVNIYHPRHPLGRLFHEHNHSILVQALNNLDFDLGGRKVLDVGCGKAGTGLEG